MKQYAIYSISPAPWGDNYRLVESFETIEDTIRIREALEEVNINCNTYKIIEWPEYD